MSQHLKTYKLPIRKKVAYHQPCLPLTNFPSDAWEVSACFCLILRLNRTHSRDPCLVQNPAIHQAHNLLPVVVGLSSSLAYTHILPLQRNREILIIHHLITNQTYFNPMTKYINYPSRATPPDPCLKVTEYKPHMKHKRTWSTTSAIMISLRHTHEYHIRVLYSVCHCIHNITLCMYKYNVQFYWRNAPIFNN